MNREPSNTPEFSLSFPRANDHEVASGTIKKTPEDFYVEELFAPELSQVGEHVWLWVEKREQNTEYVAKQLARFAGVRSMDVGYSGLKDRWALTRQWFSIYMGNKPESSWSEFDCDGVRLLEVARHSKKLRRGEHSGNRFKIKVSDLVSTASLADALIAVKENGFPNYYGTQRFGREGENLKRGHRYFLGQIKASRSQRSFYLSAARSFLFNLTLAASVRDGSWLDEGASGPLFGDPVEGIAPLTERESEIIDAYPVLKSGLHKNRLRLERRLYRVLPDNFSWEINENDISLGFDLPTGVFATSLLDEIFTVNVAQPQRSDNETSTFQ